MANQTDPARSFAAVTPHDSTDFPPCRALYVGTGGNVVAVGLDEAAVTFTNVQNGSVLPLQCRRVNDTDTTASNIVALY